ncbi:MAG: Sulfatase [Planctomycetaceae bacterium]|nr:Sulfatase [Planctomycetaceae bacterium]
MKNNFLHRRDCLSHLATGLGGIALASILPVTAAAESPRSTPLAKVKRIIQLFMNGGASQCDLFDYKPELIARHGQAFDPGNGERVEASISVPGAVMQSPYTWAKHGACGRYVSSALPHLAKCVDDMAFLMAMTSKSNVHGPATYLQNTGFLLPGFPTMGAWVSYGLGSLADNVPAYVVLPDPRGYPYNGRSAFTSGFLPANHQGTIINASAPQPITHLTVPDSAKHVTPLSRAEGLNLLRDLNASHAAERQDDSRLRARIQSYEMAARFQLAAPGLLDLAGETQMTQESYGLHQPETAGFGRNCLLARRMIERGVRFIQVWSGHGGGAGNWDNHSNIPQELGFIARSMDQPAAALLRDLKQRGLLEDTLLIWTTEFGRMPFSQGSVGRDHNGGTFVSWFAGAGIKPGVAHGESDSWSWKAVNGATTCYDFHATILHLLGIDHTHLTFRHNGIDRRLTDVHGHVISEILA